MNTGVRRVLLMAVGVAVVLGLGEIARAADMNESTPDTGMGAMSQEQKVNLNYASVDELAALPGLSYDQAKAIVDYRDANGPFTDVDQLLGVRGIAEDDLDNVRDRLSVW